MRAQPAYQDRREAGEILARHVQERIGSPDDAVILALPRGGVPVGFEVARALGAELDVVVVRKLGAPGFEEFAIGAIAVGGFQVLNEDAIRELAVTEQAVAAVAAREAAELHRREKEYRDNRPPVRVASRIAILVDDGLATGFTMRAAVAAVRERRPHRLVVAIPVGAIETCQELEREVGVVVCPLQPDPFQAVGLWYRDFTPTTDEEVRECLAAAAVNYEAAHPST